MARDHIFISYSHQDQRWLTKLETHLKHLIREEKIVVWNDTLIQPGDRWQEKIETALSSAAAVLLLVSANFIASDFIFNHELPMILELAERNRLKVLWIAVGASSYKITKIAAYQALNDPLHPLDMLRGGKLNQEFVRIAEKISAAVSPPDEKHGLASKKQTKVIGLRFADTTGIFKDRQEEMARLRKMLADPASKVICVVGRAGMGKTALLSRVGFDIEQGVVPLASAGSEERPRAILYLTCQNMAGGALDVLFSAFTQALDPEDALDLNACLRDPRLSASDKVHYLLTKLCNGRWVLMLDDFEQALGGDGVIADPDLRAFVEVSLLAPHGLSVLMGSRARIIVDRLQGVRLLELREGIPEGEAILLLRDLDADGTRGIRELPADELLQIVNSCYRIPRALELVCSILFRDPTLRVRDLVSDRNLFNEQVVENLVVDTFKRVNSDQRRVLEALAVLREPVQDEAVRFLLSEQHPGINTRECLQSMVRDLLVYHHRDIGAFNLHPLDQQHIYAQMGKDDLAGRNGLHSRAAEFNERMSVVSSPTSLEEIHPQVEARRHRYAAGEYEKAGEIAAICGRLMNRWGYYTTVDRMLDETIATTSGYSLAEAFMGKTAVHSLRNEWQLALVYNRQAIEIFSTGTGREEKKMLCRATINRAYIHTRLAQFADASALARKGLVLAQDLNDEGLSARALGQLSLVALTTGDYDDVFRDGQRALQILRQLPLPEVGTTYDHMHDIIGLAHLRRGEIDEALASFNDSLNLRLRLNNVLGLGHAYANIGAAYLALGQLERSLENLSLSLRTREAINHVEGLVETHRLLGSIHQAAGRRSEALTEYQRTFELAKGIEENVTVELVRSRIALGSLCLEMAQVQEALQHLRLANASAREIGLKPEQSASAYYLALCTEKENPLAAREWMREAIEIAQRLRIKLSERSGAPS